MVARQPFCAAIVVPAPFRLQNEERESVAVLALRCLAELRVRINFMAGVDFRANSQTGRPEPRRVLLIPMALARSGIRCDWSPN